MSDAQADSPVVLELQAVTKVYSDANGLVAVSEVSLDFGAGEFVCILGPSGCGKTTLLRMMAGLLPVTSGRILLGDKLVEGPNGDVVLLFQEYGRSLLPWRRVLENVELGLEAKRVPRQEREQLAKRFLEIVGLRDFETHFPWQLSGGMQQRVALARALACSPKVLLMDEPFGSLDARTRDELEDVFINIWLKLRTTIVFVTHDIDEAIYLGQKIILLSERPGTVRTIERVSVGYPRDQLTTKQGEAFLTLRAKIYRALRSERLELQ